MKNSFGTRATLNVSGRDYDIARIPTLEDRGFSPDRLPFALKILLENLLRREDGRVVPAADIESLLNWDPKAAPSTEIAFMPARVLLQDFTGVPAIVDLAAMRDAMVSMGGDPSKINPLQPAELVIDHSVQVDEYGSEAALLINAEKEFERNEERYLFLRWGQSAFENFRVVPPATGIVHQVNLEYLARGVMGVEGNTFAYPDTLVGTDSHTTMINGLGVLGWGVGGIEAEAAMLGQPISMLIPQVVGFRLVGELRAGSTATDLVLRVVEILRKHGVVGKFVEFFGPGLNGLRLADRATLANMAPEYGATCGIFPVDAQAIDYLRFSGRSEEQVALVEAYCKEQGLYHSADSPEPEYSDVLELDLSSVVPSLAGPKRPQDRIALTDMKKEFLAALPSLAKGSSTTVQLGGVTEQSLEPKSVTTTLGEHTFELRHGVVVIAAITSCTNTSNPAVMVAAGLLAKKAVEAGLKTQPWVKTSLAPGSKVVTEYLDDAGLTPYLNELKFNTVGYGCTTCIGNSGPLREPISKAIAEGDLVATSVLSGNRNFEGRISSEVRANYLASPPLVVAYALAGRVDIDLETEPLGEGPDGPVYLRDLWPTAQEVQATVESSVRSEMFREQYASVFEGSEEWRSLAIPEGKTYAWAEDSTYVRLPPFFVDLPREPSAVSDLEGARALAVLGDTVTTDHISPAGAISPDSPAGRYLVEHGVEAKDFNSYGSRRGNHEVMMRGTFANVRLRNLLVPGVEGGFTRYFGTDEQMSIYDAAMQYQQDGVPLVVLAGSEYGTGSSRDWAAKGSTLLGIRAVIATSFERIHRSNLIGMGVAPIEFKEGDSVDSLGLNGEETFSIAGLAQAFEGGLSAQPTVTISAQATDGSAKRFEATLRLDTPQEGEYYRHGGILQYVLRELLAS